MTSDQTVRAAVILRTLAEVKRRGSWMVIAELEKLEPDLLEYLLSGLCMKQIRLSEHGTPGEQVLPHLCRRKRSLKRRECCPIREYFGQTTKNDVIDSCSLISC